MFNDLDGKLRLPLCQSDLGHIREEWDVLFFLIRFPKIKGFMIVNDLIEQHISMSKNSVVTQRKGCHDSL